MTRARRGIFYLLFAIILAVTTLAGAETIVRVAGYRPLPKLTSALDNGITVEPGGKFFSKNDQVGYGSIPGNYRVTLANGVGFTVTNGADTLRITHESDVPAKPNELWLFGCSFTYGWGVNDDETYAWRVSHALPDTDVVNYAVSGYGTLQSLIQFQNALAAGRKPRLAVLAYASFHDERNTFLRGRRKSLVPWIHLGPMVQPFARLQGGKLAIEPARVEYTPWPLQQKLAVVNMIEEVYNRFEDVWVDSPAVTDAVIARFIETGRANGVPVLVVSLTQDARTAAAMKTAGKNGAMTGDIFVDRSPPGYSIPGDGHPSKITHGLYADKLLEILRSRHIGGI